MTVSLASGPPELALFDGGPEQAAYTVTADGTGTAFCLHVYALKRKMAMGYDSVSISVGDKECPEF